MGLQTQQLNANDIEGLKKELNIIIGELYSTLESLMGLGNSDDKYISVKELALAAGDGLSIDIDKNRLDKLYSSVASLRATSLTVEVLKKQIESLHTYLDLKVAESDTINTNTVNKLNTLGVELKDYVYDSRGVLKDYIIDEFHLKDGIVDLVNGRLLNGTLSDIFIANAPSGYNLQINSDFDSGFDGWEVIGDFDIDVVAVVAGALGPKSGLYAAQNVAGMMPVIQSKRPIPIQMDRVYILEFYAKTYSGTTGKVSLSVLLFDETNTPIAGDTADIWYLAYNKQIPSGAFNVGQFLFGLDTTHAFPANARYMKVRFTLNEIAAGGSAGDSIQQIQGIRIREVIEAAFIKDLAVTSAKIASVEANKIVANTLSAISADLGTITAGSMNINNKFLVNSDGTVTIRNSATGARLEVYNNVIKVYDSANVLRVKLGDLT